MKNTKTKVILSVIILLSVVSFVGTVVAASSSLYVSPASLTKTASDTFSASVGVDSSGNKVCAVEGTLVFNNLTCQSITVASDVTPQSLPTCSNPYFLLGVPSCTTTNKVLFTVSARAGNAGTASISFTGVDIIGEGVSLGSASSIGSYTINAVPKPTPTPTPTPATTPQTNNGFVGYVNGKIQTFPTQEAAQQAGATGIQPNYQYYPSGTTPTPSSTPEITTPETEQQPTEIPTEVPAVESPNLFLATVSSFITLGTGNNLVGAIVLFAIALIVYLSYSYFAKKKK